MKIFKRCKRWICPGLAAALCMLSLSGCTTHQDPVSRTDILFDTVVTITLYGPGQEELLDSCFALGREYEQLFSRTIETSEISQINAPKGQPVVVSDDTAALIEAGLYYSELSGGAFDITIAPLSSLWAFGEEDASVPEPEAIEEALSHVGYQQVHLDGSTVWLDDPEAALDLGAIAKGFIADKMKEYLLSQDVSSAIIDLGGNVLTIGCRPDGEAYRIGIQRPFAEQYELTGILPVEDSSVVTSGVYERYFYEGDTLYHHILNPSTGYPYVYNLLSVTILSPRSVDGDGLSTTCFALGLEEGTRLIESLDGIGAMFITDDYEIHWAGEHPALE